MDSASLQHGKAAHTGPTSRASLLFQTDVSTLVLPSHSVKEERAVLPHTYQPNFGSQICHEPARLLGATYPGRRDAMRGRPEGCLRVPNLIKSNPTVSRSPAYGALSLR